VESVEGASFEFASRFSSTRCHYANDDDDDDDEESSQLVFSAFSFSFYDFISVPYILVES
jgi:hypothetical protein